MTFPSGPIDYHPGINDPWLILSLGLVAILAACATIIARRSRLRLIAAGIVAVAASPFVVSALMHGLYSVVDSETERMLCTHYVRRSILPECFAAAGIALGLIGRSRQTRHQVSHG
jgi:hypothetical protein